MSLTNDTRPLDIIIIGGGLAGLAAAGYLREQHNVTVLERYPLKFEKNIKNDYGMSIVANAYKLLLAQGVKDENLEAVLFTHLWNCSKDNDNIKSTVFDTRPIFGAPSIFTRRSRLQSELYRFATDSSRPGKPARILGGVNIVSVDPIAGIVTTETGEIYSGDLIVGADGINSSVRAAVQAYSATPTPEAGSAISVSEGTAAVPTGLIGYTSVVPVEVIASEPDIAFQTAEGVGGICLWQASDESENRILCYPCDNKEYYQIFAYASESTWVEEFEKNKTNIIRDVPVERVLKEFATFHPTVKKLLSYTPTHNVWRIRDIDPLNNWIAGKTILIGDAAHAITPHVGQGCNIAIEDAEALGYLFRDITLPASTSVRQPASSVTKQLALFQSLRMQRAQLVQFTSRQAGRLLKGEEKEKAGAFDRAAFGKLIYGYSGAEAAYKALLAEADK